GGEAQAVTNGTPVQHPYRDVSMFKWSPDGTQIAYLKKDTLSELDVSRRASGHDEINFEAHSLFTRVYIVNLATRKTQLVTRGDVQVWEFDWSPDGNELVLVCSAQPYEWSWYDSWLARVPTSGGA